MASPWAALSDAEKTEIWEVLQEVQETQRQGSSQQIADVWHRRFRVLRTGDGNLKGRCQMISHPVTIWYYMVMDPCFSLRCSSIFF